MTRFLSCVCIVDTPQVRRRPSVIRTLTILDRQVPFLVLVRFEVQDYLVRRFWS